MERKKENSLEEYEARAEELVSMTLGVCEAQLIEPARPSALGDEALTHAAMGVCESVKTFIAVSRLTAEKE